MEVDESDMQKEKKERFNRRVHSIYYRSKLLAPPPVSDVGSVESVCQMSSLVGEKSSTTVHNCTEESLQIPFWKSLGKSHIPSGKFNHG